jgi:hypothetical protein
VLSVAETIGPERAKVAYFWALGKTAKSARTLRNTNKHAGLGEKKPPGEPVSFDKWWSWRDLNPRPQAIFEQIYMFSGLIWVSP